MSSLLSSVLRRHLSKVVLVPQFDPKVVEEIKSNTFKPRHHPGRRSTEVYRAPDKVHDAAKIIISKVHEANIQTDGQIMRQYMKARHIPAEKHEMVKNMHQLRESVMNKIGLDGIDLEETYNEEDILSLDRGVRRKVNKLLKQQTYNWEPINFTEYIARVYLWNQFVPEYAVLKKVLEEIQKRVEDYKPHSVFDFGSGIGTAIWATHSCWAETIQEFYCVDISVHMADLSSLLIQGGRQNRHPDIRHVVYRQFLPALTTNKYSLVICAYTLLELASQKQRIQTLAKLWEKAEDFLIIVDHGSVSGSKVVLEARDYILSLNKKKPGTSHVFAPCPHDSPCPKVENVHHCNFGVKYENNLTYARGERDIRVETFCYVIMRRGPKQETDPQWPRIVRPVLIRSKHTVCKLCTRVGESAQMVFTKRKHGMFEHRCVKGSKWGDLLPITIQRDTVDMDDGNDQGEDDNIDDNGNREIQDNDEDKQRDGTRQDCNNVQR